MPFDESKHPREENGEFTDGNGSYRQNTDYQSILENDKRKEAVKKYSDDPKRDVAEMGLKKIPELHNFNRMKTKHHLRHIQEFGFKNEKEYYKAAKDFWESEEGTFYRGSARVDIVKYDPGNGRFLISTLDGTIKSFYNIKSNKFQKIMKQEGYQEWKK